MRTARSGCGNRNGSFLRWNYLHDRDQQTGRKAVLLRATRRASRETGIPQPTVWRVLRERLHLKPYKLTMIQHITDEDKVARMQFCVEIFDRIEDNETLLDNVIFSDESTFHISRCV